MNERAAGPVAVGHTGYNDERGYLTMRAIYYANLEHFLFLYMDITLLSLLLCNTTKPDAVRAALKEKEICNAKNMLF